MKKNIFLLIFILSFNYLFAVYNEAEYTVYITGPTIVVQNVSTKFHATVKDSAGKIYYDKDFSRTLKKLGETIITNTITFTASDGLQHQIVGTYEVTVVDTSAFNYVAIITGPKTVIQNVSTKFHITVKDGLNNIFYDRDFYRTLKKLGQSSITNTVTFVNRDGIETKIVGTYDVTVVDSSTQIIPQTENNITEPLFSNPATKSNALEQIIVNAINSAQTSIDVAIYSFADWPVVNALVEAANRLGKDKVRIVTEYENYTYSGTKNYYNKLENAGIKIITDAAGGGGSGLSHNKFFIIDNQKVIVGSANATYTSYYTDNNNMIEISSPQAVAIYAAEFKQMYEQKLFGRAKNSSADHTFQYTPEDYKNNNNLININTASVSDFTKLYGIGTTIATNIVNYRNANGPFKSIDDLSKVSGVKSTIINANRRYMYVDSENTKTKTGEIYFAPKDNVEAQIINAINSAKYTIEFAMFTFTDNEIANSIIAAINRGVKVSGIYDDYQAGSKYCTINTLKEAGATVYTDASENLMHNKYLIIDGEKVITGSYNYTASANTANDENIIILNDKSTAVNYYLNFKSIIPSNS
ncbi:MAG TPA: phospholipase D-like domain-containing protein [bacterium]|nr:phospholipase D-like domain-containing protein [bacterium]HOL48600.1 phospholipase D-like domain-containing protein [bacterium]HPQ18582.1 phospholipase D-like domain-containing protein [bacterium]